MITFSFDELEQAILEKLREAGYSDLTRRAYHQDFTLMKRIASDHGLANYCSEVAELFVEGSPYINPKNSDKTKSMKAKERKRLVKFIDSYIENGALDLSKANHYAEYPILSPEFQHVFLSFQEVMKNRGLRPGTTGKYSRFVWNFISFLEMKGITTIADINHGDVTKFVAFICSSGLKPTALGGIMPGLKLFLESAEGLSQYLAEIPKHLPKGRRIIDIYNDSEYQQTCDCINTSDTISLRDKAISMIAIDAGVRSIDITQMKLEDIDWEHDIISIIQSKTGKRINIPLTPDIGNRIVDYLMYERPDVKSEYVFLTSYAPYKVIDGHSPVRKVLKNVMDEAGIDGNGRSYGTRITRHSYASRLLRNDVPVQTISEALGHRDPNTSMVYITTDNENLSKCTLKMPKVVKRCQLA